MSQNTTESENSQLVPSLIQIQVKYELQLVDLCLETSQPHRVIYGLRSEVSWCFEPSQPHGVI